MRQLLIALALALAPAAASAASLGVPLDQSIRIGLKAQPHAVIVGNPAIADVTVADSHHLIVTGKTSGVTNLIVTDAAGRAILDRQLVVSASTGDHVALISGSTVTSYACAPSCAMVAGAQQSLPAATTTSQTTNSTSTWTITQAPVQASPATP
jgi:Flp pilus assembly secretin CpaC